MLIEKLFLLHRLLFIPYFNNPQGGGEGREGGYSQWWPLRPILPQKGCNEKVGILLPEEYESLRLQGILSFRSVLWPKSATKGFKSRANFSVLWYVYSWGKCIYSSLKREGQSSKLSMWNGYHLSMKGIPAKGVPFLLKTVYKRARGWTLEGGWGGGGAVRGGWRGLPPGRKLC